MRSEQDWSSRSDISELICRYNRGVDNHDRSLLADLFAEDCVLETMGRVFTGRDAVVELLTAGGEKDDARPMTAHHTGNVLISVQGDDATAESDFLVVRRGERLVEVVMAGRFFDRFRREISGWRLVHRVTEPLARAIT